jgi:transcriptional regulator
MHYEAFKQKDPRVLKALIENFPFATITVNGPDGPIVARVPITFKQGSSANGVVEFHLAKENPIVSYLQNGTNITVTINGPSSHISPSWYTHRFSGEKPDRSKTAPTYNYISADMSGTLQVMSTLELTQQIDDLVSHMEPGAGNNSWAMSEIDKPTFTQWRERITGFRMPIERFDLTAKLSQEQNAADKPGIIAGLRQRGGSQDIVMAQIIELFNGTPNSLIKALHATGFKSSDKHRG